MCFKMSIRFVLLIVAGLTVKMTATEQHEKPHIIVIIADDMGFNDVSFHGSAEIPTPNIDALAYNGVILNSHYTQALCTPSRSAFLTGKYPIHLGMQHLVILEPEPWGLPLNETVLPQYLKKNGYTTHAIGKWHLGFFKKEYTPTYRGFDSHFGYWQGLQDYYEHTVHATFTPEYGYDMRRNMSVDWDAKGKYSTTLFTDEAVKLISDHNTQTPMFMYLAHLAPHTGNDKQPLQAPDEEIAKFAHIRDPERRVYAAMVSMLDRSVGSVVTALREKEMLENSIIIFMSDNGAKPEGIHANHGSNYPLRGSKNSAWEGGIRNVAAIWSPLIKKPQRVHDQLFHISDWLPTLYSAAGLNHTDLPKNLDGIDQWQSISEGTVTPRTELLVNIDDVYNYGGIRQGDWKYVYGSTSNGKNDIWYPYSGLDQDYDYEPEAVLNSPVANAIAGALTYQQIREKYEHRNFTINLIDEQAIQKLRRAATVKCKELTDEEKAESMQCNTVKGPCLFNIKEDPCERVNLISKHPVIVTMLEEAIMNYKKTQLPLRNVPRDPNADPAKWNNTWTNWQDHEFVLKEKIAFNTMSPLSIGLIAGACIAVVIVVIILVTLKCKTSKKRSRTASLEEEDFERMENMEEMIPKGSDSFQDRERRAKTSIKNELRTVE